MSDRPEFTIAEAATACGVSAKTIRRRVQNDAFPNAHRTGRGPWLISVEDLLADGLQPGKPSPPDLDEPEPAVTDKVDADLAELARLREQNAELRRRAEVAEAIAQERERTIETQATALKMIEAAPAPVDQLERLAAERDEARANARWGYRRRLRKPETGP
ncbi:helix-turn-helix domain-containing protein [bacterium]|nr:helix-turn-helix domain-containing protein [bacterium]